MKKPIKDMTAEEKQKRIEHLSHKFYDINERPSLLLRSEMQDIEQDRRLSDLLRNLEIQETHRCKIEQEYQTNVVPELRKLKRVFEYQYEKLLAEQEKLNTTSKFDPLRRNTKAQIEKNHKQKMAELKKAQQTQKDLIQANITAKFNECDDTIRNIFMSAIKYLYR